MSYTVEQLTGLVNSVQSHYGKNKVTDIASDLQDYVVMDKLLKEHKVVYSGGKDYKFNVTATLGGNSRHIGLFDTDNVSVSDSVAQGTVPWKFTQTSYAFDIKEEAINSGDPEQIVDHIRLRRDREIAGMAELMETDFWTNSATSSASNKIPFGLPYWVCKVASGYTAIANHGFIGSDPSGFTAGAAGLAVADYPNWQNYAGNYTNVSKADLVKMMRRAASKCKFKSPIKHPSYDTTGRADKYQIYVNLETKEAFEDVGEAQNDNLGRDIASMDDTITFRKNPIVWIPYLDSDASDPVYMINWGMFHIACMKNFMMKENTKPAPMQNDVVQTFVEVSWNTACENRRAHAVLSKAV